MPKRGFLSCIEEAAKKLLPGGGGGFSEDVVQPSLAESSAASLDILPETVIDFSHLKPTFDQVEFKLFGMPGPVVLKRFIELFETGLSGVSFPWEDIFKDSLSSKRLDVSHIPQPVYTDLVEWINFLMDNEDLCTFVLWTFGYIVDSVSHSPRLTEGRERFPYSNVSILVALAMILRTTPNVLYMLRGSLKRMQFEYLKKGIVPTPLTVWMIAQVSQAHTDAGVYLWVSYLLPLLGSNSRDPHSRDLILQLAEKIMEKPEAKADLLAKSDWYNRLLIPSPSFEILLQLRFPATPAREEEDTARFARIYKWLKDVALASALKRDAVIQKIFAVSLRSAGKGIKGNNPVLAEEAAAIAIWSLTKNVVCWEHWNSLCKANLKASVALLKKLVEKWNDHSLSKTMKQQFTQHIFTVSLRLVGKGNSVLAKEAAAIAIWSLTENIDRWENLYKENIEASVALLKKLVEKWNDHSLSKAMKQQFTQHIFTDSLRLVGKGNSVLAKEAAAIAIWSLTENIDCWNRWDNLYKENIEASVALLKELVEKWNDPSVKLLSSPSDTLTLSQTMKSFRLKNKKANGYLYKEADKSCKVISGRLSCGSSSLKGTCITAVVLVFAGAGAALVLSESVFGFYM